MNLIISKGVGSHSSPACIIEPTEIAQLVPTKCILYILVLDHAVILYYYIYNFVTLGRTKGALYKKKKKQRVGASYHHRSTYCLTES